MKSCPGCLFLIDDDQELCEPCREQQASALAPLTIGSAEGGTAVLDRPRVAAPEEMVTIRYRSSGPAISFKSVVVGVLLLAVIGSVASAAGYGPLAPKFASWNLTFNRPEAFPQRWDHLDDLSTVFEVDLPVGSKTLFEPLDPTGKAPGGIVGKSVTTPSGAKMLVAWSNFGMSDQALAAYDTPEGTESLLGRYAEIRVPGEMTTQRSVTLPIGHAVDAVFVKGDSTTRVRMVMTPKEAFILATSGPDSFSEALDASHQRLLKSFSPNL